MWSAGDRGPRTVLIWILQTADRALCGVRGPRFLRGIADRGDGGPVKTLFPARGAGDRGPRILRGTADRGDRGPDRGNLALVERMPSSATY